MTRIGHIDQLAAIIRQQMQLAAQAPKAERLRARKVKDAKLPERKDLGEMVSQRLLAITAADPDRGRKAFRAFIECLLLSQFGEELINEAGFNQLVDDVLHAIHADPELQGVVEAATAQLLPG